MSALYVIDPWPSFYEKGMKNMGGKVIEQNIAEKSHRQFSHQASNLQDDIKRLYFTDKETMGN